MSNWLVTVVSKASLSSSVRVNLTQTNRSTTPSQRYRTQHVHKLAQKFQLMSDFYRNVFFSYCTLMGHIYFSHLMSTFFLSTRNMWKYQSQFLWLNKKGDCDFLSHNSQNTQILYLAIQTFFPRTVYSDFSHRIASLLQLIASFFELIS